MKANCIFPLVTYHISLLTFFFSYNISAPLTGSWFKIRIVAGNEASQEGGVECFPEPPCGSPRACREEAAVENVGAPS